MNYPKHVWDQLKNITVQRLIRALTADGWARVAGRKGASQAFVNDDELFKRLVTWPEARRPCPNGAHGLHWTIFEHLERP